MQKTWERIERWLSKNAPDILADLCDGATAEDIRWAEGQLGCEFPEAFKLSHMIHDGAESCALLECLDFYSLTEIVKAWKGLKHCYDRGFFDEVQSDPQGPTIRSEWWNPKWIPLTDDCSGNHICMDLQPDEDGQVGQVISWWHDAAERELIAPTYEAWWKQTGRRPGNGRVLRRSR